MNSAQKTLIEIASVSQRVVSTLTRHVGRKTVKGFRLGRVVGSGSILEIVNKKWLLENDRVDVRLVDWLDSREPQACLDTLCQMGGDTQQEAKIRGEEFLEGMAIL